MKKRLLLWLAAPAALLLLSGAALAAGHNRTVTLTKDQTVNNDYFAAGNEVEIAGTVNGDVYAAGSRIIIDGTVNGDVLAAGATITISGTVNGNIRVTGGTVTVTGPIQRSATVGAGTFVLTNSGSIGANLVAGGSNIEIAGNVKGYSRIGGGTVSITGQMDKDVMAGTTQLDVGSNASLGGSLTYWSNQQADIAAGSQIKGSVTHNNPPERPSTTQQAGARVASLLFKLGVLLLTGAVLLLLFPVFSRDVVKEVERRPWAALGWGFVALFVTPVIGVVLLITVLGIPLGIILFFAYVTSLILASIWTALVVGDLVAKGLKIHNSAYIVLLIGALIYFIVGLVPILGALATFVGLLIGLGGFWMVLRHGLSRSRQAIAK